MAIVITCDGCGQRFKAGEQHAGRRVRCPGCEGVVNVPVPDDRDEDAPKVIAATGGEGYDLGEHTRRAVTETGAPSPLQRAAARVEDQDQELAANAGLRGGVVGGGVLLLMGLCVGLWWLSRPGPTSAQPTPRGTQPSLSSAAGKGGRGPAPALMPPQVQQKNQKGGYFSVLHKSRDRAKGVNAMHNMRQMIIGIRTYELSYGKYPRSLQDLINENPSFAQIMSNPRTGDPVGYIYVPPRRGAKGTTPVLYEAYQGQIDPEGAIGYLDGHVALP